MFVYSWCNYIFLFKHWNFFFKSFSCLLFKVFMNLLIFIHPLHHHTIWLWPLVRFLVGCDVTHILYHFFDHSLWSSSFNVLKTLITLWQRTKKLLKQNERRVTSVRSFRVRHTHCIQQANCFSHPMRVPPPRILFALPLVNVAAD